MQGVPATAMYASVVSRETLCIKFTIAILDEIKVKAAGVMNAYITAIKENIWTLSGPKVGKD